VCRHSGAGWGRDKRAGYSPHRDRVVVCTKLDPVEDPLVLVADPLDNVDMALKIAWLEAAGKGDAKKLQALWHEAKDERWVRMELYRGCGTQAPGARGGERRSAVGHVPPGHRARRTVPRRPAHPRAGGEPGERGHRAVSPRTLAELRQVHRRDVRDGGVRGAPGRRPLRARQHERGRVRLRAPARGPPCCRAPR